MSRQMLVQGQVYRLQVPRPLDKRKARMVPGLAWRLVGTAALGLVAAGIVALLGHGGGRNAGTSQAVLVTPAAKSSASAPRRVDPAPPTQTAQAQIPLVQPPPVPPPVIQPPPQAEKAVPDQAVAGLTAPSPSTTTSPSPSPTTPPGGAPPVGAFSPRSTGSVPASSTPASPASRDLTAPPPPSAAPAQTAAVATEAAEAPAPSAKAEPASKRAVASGADAPTGCLPAGLQSVLADLGARFGAVTVVSTTHLHTDNHARGSVRAKLHEACKAVDFKVSGDAKPVLAYLKSRPEVAGINVYRNNSLIHIDHNAGQKAARAPSEAEPAAPVKTRKAAPVKAERKKVARTKARPRRTAAKTSPKPGGADAASE